MSPTRKLNGGAAPNSVWWIKRKLFDACPGKQAANHGASAQI
jgi:hypothetical protein